MPSDGEADRWTSDGESSSRRDSPLLPDVWSYTLSQHNFSNSSTLKIDHGIRGNLLCLSTAMLQPAVREHAHGTGSPAAPCKRLVIQPATATPSTPWRWRVILGRRAVFPVTSGAPGTAWGRVHVGLVVPCGLFWGPSGVPSALPPVVILSPPGPWRLAPGRPDAPRAHAGERAATTDLSSAPRDGAHHHPSLPGVVTLPPARSRAHATADGPGVIRSPQRLLDEAQRGVRRSPRAPTPALDTPEGSTWAQTTAAWFRAVR